MALSLVHRFAPVKPVVEKLVDEPLVDRIAALVPDTLLGQLPHEPGGRSELDEALEDAPDQSRLALVHLEPAVLDVVAERRPAPHPHAAGTGGRELVPDPLPDHLPLELGKGQQYVEGQPPHTG